MPGWVRIASTASRSPCTTENAPAGRPASASSSASSTRRRGILLGGLEDEGVAAGERDRRHPQRHHGREVERRDAGDDAERHPERVRVDPRGDLRGRLALEQVPHAAGELDDLKPARHLAAGVGEHLAVLAGDEAGEVVAAGVDELPEREHDLRAARERCAAPLGGGRRRGVDGAVDRSRVGERDARRPPRPWRSRSPPRGARRRPRLLARRSSGPAASLARSCSCVQDATLLERAHERGLVEPRVALGQPALRRAAAAERAQAALAVLGHEVGERAEAARAGARGRRGRAARGGRRARRPGRRRRSRAGRRRRRRPRCRARRASAGRRAGRAARAGRPGRGRPS